MLGDGTSMRTRPDSPDEINPDILGFIFEQYINFTEAGQKDKGAYYTKAGCDGLHGSFHDPAPRWRIVSSLLGWMIRASCCPVQATPTFTTASSTAWTSRYPTDGMQARSLYRMN